MAVCRGGWGRNSGGSEMEQWGRNAGRKKEIETRGVHSGQKKKTGKLRGSGGRHDRTNTETDDSESRTTIIKSRDVKKKTEVKDKTDNQTWESETQYMLKGSGNSNNYCLRLRWRVKEVGRGGKSRLSIR